MEYRDIVISAMTSEDIDQVLDIERLCFSLPWSEESFRMEVEKNQCARYLVARTGNRVIGYVGMWVILDEGHITNLAVHPDYRGNKVALKLMENLIILARKMRIEKLTLEVRSTNFIAQNLYKKLGFCIAGVRKGYYADNKEDALIMWKKGI